MTDQPGLAKFDAPPVQEVAISVEFLPISTLGVVDLVTLSSDWRDRYPSVREQVALPPSRQPGVLISGAGLQISQGVGPVRLWLLSDGGERLLQLQYDRIILNWRREVSPGNVIGYPSYKTLRSEYAHEWGLLTKRVLERFGHQVVPVVGEVTFVNKISCDWYEPSVVMRDLNVSSLPGSPMHFNYERGASLVSPAETMGELLVVCQSVIDEDTQQPKDLILSVSTRVGVPDLAEGGSTGILSMLDWAHDTSVDAFTRMTLDEMHNRWKRTQ